jgi:apolipoprotein N-acyltransferase
LNTAAKRAALLILVSAGLHAAAFPPWNASIVAAIALAPLFVALYEQRLRVAFALGVLWGVAAHWAEAFWILPAMAFYYQQPWWFAALFGIGSSLLFRGLHYGVLAAVLAWLVRGRCGLTRAFLAASVWTAFELLRARGPTADPWLLLGYAFVPHPLLLQVADLGGMYLLSFAAAAANAAGAEIATAALAANAVARHAMLRGAARAAIALGALLIAICTYGAYRLVMPPPAGSGVPISIVQGNNDLGAQWHAEFYGQGLQRYLDLSRAAAQRSHPRAFIWPESAVTFFLAREPTFLAPIRALLRDTGAELIAGAPHIEDADPARPVFFNSAFAVSASGIDARYDKERLLPFAEFFPLSFGSFLRRKFNRIRSFTPGVGVNLPTAALGEVAVVICFEAVFADLVRERMRQGADLLVNLSNDAWLGDGSGPLQHLAMVVPRAVENRTWLVRATTTGISAVVDPYGVVHQATAPFSAAVIDAEVVPARTDTLYQRWGDWFAWCCVAICVAASVRRSR